MARTLCMLMLTVALLPLCESFLLRHASSLQAPFRQYQAVMTRVPLQAVQRTPRVQRILDFEDPEIVLKTGTTVDRVLVWVMLVTNNIWSLEKSKEPSDVAQPRSPTWHWNHCD